MKTLIGMLVLLSLALAFLFGFNWSRGEAKRNRQQAQRYQGALVRLIDDVEANNTVSAAFDAQLLKKARNPATFDPLLGHIDGMQGPNRDLSLALFSDMVKIVRDHPEMINRNDAALDRARRAVGLTKKIPRSPSE